MKVFLLKIPKNTTLAVWNKDINKDNIRKWLLPNRVN